MHRLIAKRSQVVRRLMLLIAVVIGLVGLSGSGVAYADDSMTFTTVPTVTITHNLTANPSDPVVSGSFLRASNTGWVPDPHTYSYEWMRDGVPIDAGPDTWDYYVTDADVSHEITVTVTAHLDGYADSSSTSAPTYVEADAAITGGSFSPSPRVGRSVSFEDSSTTPSDATLAYQWFRSTDPTHILSTSPSYIPVTGDDASELDLSVTVSAPDYISQTMKLSTWVLPGVLTPDQVGIDATPVIGLPIQVTSRWNPAVTITSFQWNLDGHPIRGATKDTYTPVAKDFDKRLSVTERVTAPDYDPVTYTTPRSNFVTKSFREIPRPTVTGTPAIGSTLTAHHGDWSPSSSLYTYQWYVNGQYEGTGRTFIPSQHYDIGSTVTVVVTGSNAQYGPMNSRPSLPSRPIKAGSLRAGTVSLSGVASNNEVCASLKGWVGTYGFTYEWFIDGVLVDNDTAWDECFIVPLGDQDSHLSVTAIESAEGFPTVSASSKSYLIGMGNYRATNPSGVPIIGPISVGGTVSIDESDWTPTPTHFVVEWYLNDGASKPIATGSTLTIPASAYGDELIAKATASGPVLHPGSAFTSAFVVSAGTFTVSSPTIAGTPSVGSELVASHVGWAPSSGTAFHYRWFAQADSDATPVPISGATKSAYTISPLRVGDLITVRVSASRSGYTTASSSSQPTASVTS